MYIVKSPTVLTVLDILMFILIGFASYTLIFTQTEYRYFIMLIMFAYLYYFIKYRLVQYSTYKPKFVMHSLPQTYKQIKQKQERGDDKNNSLFLQEYQKRSYEKSKKQLFKEGDDKDKSYLSYMNRSKKINQSFSKNSRSQLNMSNDNGFSFLNKYKNKDNLLLRDSFLPKFKGMNDSYIKNIEMNEQTRIEKSTQLQKMMKQRMAEYGKTLNKYFIHQNNYKNTKQYLKKSYEKIKSLCLNFSKQYYNENIQNLKNIALTLQQMYQIRIKCNELPDIQKIIGNTFKAQDFTLEVNLIQLVQKILKSSKNLELNLPERRLKSMQTLNNLKSNDYFVSKRVEQSFTVSNNSLKQKLIRFANQRIRLNSYFYDQNINNLSAEQLFSYLKLIKQYEQQERQQDNYELYDRFKISQQLSQKILLVFNVSRHKINDIVGQFDYTLQFRRKSFMGWIKKQQNMFEIIQTINSDLGHPHYDVNINKQPKQKLSCKFGQQNGWSVLFMYMWALQKWTPQIIRNNSRLLKVVSDCLDLVIL